MKRTIRMLCVLLAFAMSVVMFASCGKNKGSIVAVYENTPVYEGEVQDIINYQMTMSATSSMSTEELQQIVRNAVQTYVRYKILEIDLREKGYKIDEKRLNSDVKSMIASLDESFEGGYKDWRNLCRVSKNFLKEDMRRYQLAELFAQYASETAVVTEEEMRQYYQANAMQYTSPSGYTWTGVLREVLDFNDENECATAIKEMENYARQVNAGYLTMDQVKADLIAKYTEKDGYTNKTQMFSGENFTATTEFAQIDDLAEALKMIEEAYPDLNPSADPINEKEAYETYMNYLGDVFRAEVFYGIRMLKPGEVYTKPLKSYAGYFIIRLDSIKSDNGFTPFDEVKDKIQKTLLDEKITDMFEETMVQLERAYEVSYLFAPIVSN